MFLHTRLPSGVAVHTNEIELEFSSCAVNKRLHELSKVVVGF